jgi:SAM-dependent methyltransferase
VLETGAGTGIVTRRLRDLLPATAWLIATDLNPPMLDIARKKFRADEPIEFEHADAMALPFADGSFDAVVCQFGVMFFLKEREILSRAGARGPLCIQRLGRQLQPAWAHAAWQHCRRSRGPIFSDRSAAILSGAGELQQNRPD